MSTKKELGKIDSVRFGLGGYQDVMLGIHFTFSFKGAGVCDSMCSWDAEKIECSEHAKWTEKDRDRNYAEIMRFVSKLLDDAKVDSIDKLKGVPVEVTRKTF
jgi:hypothetical protein